MMIAKHPMSLSNEISQSSESVVGPGLFRQHWFRPHAFSHTFGQTFEDEFSRRVMNVGDVTNWSSAALTTRKITTWKLQLFQRNLNLILTGISWPLDPALVLWARHLHRPVQKRKYRLPLDVFVRWLQQLQPPSEQKFSSFWNLKLWETERIPMNWWHWKLTQALYCSDCMKNEWRLKLWFYCFFV